MDSDEETDTSKDSEINLNSSYQTNYILSIHISENKRHIFCLFLIVSNFIFINCGVVFMLLSWYVKNSLEKQMTFLQDYYQPKAIPTILLVSGIMMVLTSFLGVKTAIGGRQVENDTEEAKSAAFYFLIYCIASLFIVFLILIAACTCFNEIRILHQALSKGLKAGMERYMKDGEVKIEMDLLQIEYRCCGVEGYKDWYHVSWVAVKYLDRYDSVISGSLKGDKYYGKDVPFSCCNMDTVRPCVDTRIEDVTYHSMYNYPTDLTLNSIGCREAMTNFLGHTIFLGVGFFVFFCLLIWIVVTIIARYLHTSLTLLSLGESPVGWLIPFTKTSSKAKRAMSDEDNMLQEDSH